MFGAAGWVAAWDLCGANIRRCGLEDERSVRRTRRTVHLDAFISPQPVPNADAHAHPKPDPVNLENPHGYLDDDPFEYASSHRHSLAVPNPDTIACF